MRETKTSGWLSGSVLLMVPVVLVLVGAGLGSLPESLAGVITMTADEDDLSRTFFVGGLGEGAFLGVSLEEETELDSGGARVTHVVDDSPAAKAGIEEGDVIVGFDGETIRGPVALTKKIHTKEPGDAVSLVVVRDGERRTLEAELGDRSESWTFNFGPGLEALKHLQEIEIPDIDLEIEGKLAEREEMLRQQLESLEEGLHWTRCDEEDGEDCDLNLFYDFSLSGKPRLGVQLVEVTPELREHLGADEDAGVMVSKVIAGTPAESAGIRVGDLIVALDGEKISGTSVLQKELQQRVGESFDLEVIRDRTPVRIQVTIPEAENEPATGPRAWIRPVPRAAPRALPAVPAVPGVSAVPAPAAAPEAVPPPALPAPPAPPAQRSVAREAYESQRLARAEFLEQLAQERALAGAEVSEGLERERALARAEIREAREAVSRSRDEARDLYRHQRSLERYEELRRRAASLTLL